MDKQTAIFGKIVLGPFIKQTQNQKVVCTFSLNEYSDLNVTINHEIVVFDDLAVFCHATLKRGEKIFVQGRNKLNSWKDKNNNLNEKTEVIANYIGTIQFNKINTYNDR